MCQANKASNKNISKSISIMNGKWYEKFWQSKDKTQKICHLWDIYKLNFKDFVYVMDIVYVMDVV